MALLLDTHVVVWWMAGDRRLRPKALRLIEGERRRNDVYVSALTGMELQYVAKGGFQRGAEGLRAALDEHGFRVLAFDLEDGIRATELPRLHLDPFDRALIAQADRRQLMLVTADEQIERYPIAVYRL